MVVIWLPSTNQFDFNFRCSMSPDRFAATHQLSCQECGFCSCWYLLGFQRPLLHSQQARCLWAVGFRTVTLLLVALLAFMQNLKFGNFFSPLYLNGREFLCVLSREQNCLSHDKSSCNYVQFSFPLFPFFFLFTYLSFFLQPWRSRPQPAGPTGSDFSPQ